MVPMAMLPKSARVRRSLEFRRTLDEGLKTVCPAVVLFARPRSLGDRDPSCPAVAKATPAGLDPAAGGGTSAASPPSHGPGPASSSGVRLGLIVSRKVGNAVTRNRVKRHLREAFRHLRTDLDQSSTFQAMDLVAIARVSAAQASGAELTEALTHCLRRLSRQIKARAGTRSDDRTH